MESIALRAWLDRYADEAASVVWFAALAFVEAACVEARGRPNPRWRYHPRGELRRLRRQLAAALELARFAVALAEEEIELAEQVEREARIAHEEAGRRRRREQTLPAELARLEKAARRRQQAASRPRGSSRGS